MPCGTYHDKDVERPSINLMKTEARIRTDIVALALPKIVLDIFDENPLPYDLSIWFETPCQLLSVKLEELVTPIWKSGATIVAYDHAAAPNGFFRLSIEGNVVERPRGLSWRQILVKDFKFLWELEWTDERLKEVAALFNFDCIDLLTAELSKADLSTFEKDQIWYHSFLMRIGT